MRLLLLLAAAGVAGFAPAPFPKPTRIPREDATAILGHWEFEVWEMNGQSVPVTQTLEITRGKVDFVRKASNSHHPYEFLLYPNLSPRGFEWKAKGEHYVGSYQLKGDRLTIILKRGTQLAMRPTDFNSKPEYYFVLRRTRR